MDSLEIVVYNHSDMLTNDDGKPHQMQSVDYLINGKSLLKMIRAIELPYALAEGHPDIAGGYVGVHPDIVYWTLTNQLELGGQTALFVCQACGAEECWGFYATITIENGLVTWTNYENNHRDWKYDALPEFVFRMSEYLEALQGY